MKEKIKSEIYLSRRFPAFYFTIRKLKEKTIKNILDASKGFNVFMEKKIYKNFEEIKEILIMQDEKLVCEISIEHEESILDSKFLNVSLYYAPTSTGKNLAKKLKNILKEESINKKHIKLNFYSQGWFRSNEYNLESEPFFNPLIPDLFYGIDVEALAESFFKSQQGLLILFGEPGTGKSKLIQYLVGKGPKIVNRELKVSMVKGKEAVVKLGNDAEEYLKNDLVILDDFDFVSLTRNNNDTEIANIVSTILSVTDGFLPKKVKIIISTNKKLKEIDPALLRPSRLFDILELKPIPKRYFETLCEKYPELSPGLELFETAEELKVSEILDHIDRKRIVKKDYLIDKNISKRIKAYSKEIGF